MPKKLKLSEHQNVQRFCCPYCERRLWSLGSPERFLYYSGGAEIRQNVNMLHKSAIFMDNTSACAESNSWTEEFLWIEEFLCGDHGKLWMKVNRKTCDTVVATIASQTRWATNDPLNPIKHAQFVTKRIKLLRKLSDQEKISLQQQIKRSAIFIAKKYTYSKKIYQFFQKK